MADNLEPILFAYCEPLSLEDELSADGAITFLPTECRDGDHRWRASVTRPHPFLPVGPISVVEPFLGLYEDMVTDRGVGQFVQSDVGRFRRDEGALEGPLPLARISILAQEWFAVLVEFDPGEQVIDDPLNPLAVEAADRPLPQFLVEEVIHAAEAFLRVAYSEVVRPPLDPAIEVADHYGD